MNDINYLKSLIISAKKIHSYSDMLEVLQIAQFEAFDPDFDYYIENTCSRACANFISNLRNADLSGLKEQEIVFMFERLLHLSHSEPILRTLFKLDLNFIEYISNL